MVFLRFEDTGVLDFTTVQNTGNIFLQGFFVFMGCMIMSLIICVIVHDFELLVLAFIASSGISVAFLLIMFQTTTDFTDTQRTNLQSFASETYLLTVTDKQAEQILVNQLDVNAEGDSVDTLQTQDKVQVKNVYGDKVDVGLVQDGETWSLVTMVDTAQVTK